MPVNDQVRHTLTLKNVVLYLDPEQADEVRSLLHKAHQHGLPLHFLIELKHSFPTGMMSYRVVDSPYQANTEVEVSGVLGRIAFMGPEGWEPCSECGAPKPKDDNAGQR